MAVTDCIKQLCNELGKCGIVLRGLRVMTSTALAHRLLEENEASVESINYPFRVGDTYVVQLGNDKVLLHDYPWRQEYTYSEWLNQEQFFKWRPFFDIVHSKFSNPVGAEVGVFEGFLTKFVLRYIKPAKYYLIDPYKEYHDGIGNLSYKQELWDTIFSEINARLNHDRNIQFIRKPSIEGAQDIDSECLDFAYIDADHSASAVYDDIMAWFPKIKQGGMIGGHDFIEHDVKSGVFRALVKLMNNSNAEYELKNEYNDWWFIKE